MEFYKPKISVEKLPEQEVLMENFYRKFLENNNQDIKKITLEQLRELKEQGISTEKFLDYLCQNKGILLHGSVEKINDNKLKSDQKEIFASNKSAVAVMRSLYSNSNVDLRYPYFFDKDHPFVLKIHTLENGEFISQKNGFVYIINKEGFENKPKGSWQFVKDADEIEFNAIIETEDEDFGYPVEVYKDFKNAKNEKGIGK